MAYHDDFEEPEANTLMRRIYANLEDDPSHKRRKKAAKASSNSAQKSRWLGLAGALGSIILLGVVIGLAYPRDGQQGKDAVPVIRADQQVFKTLPDDPGGMDIPHQDSTVFSSLGSKPDSSTGNKGAVENLLADTQEEQEPAPKSELFKDLQAEEDHMVRTQTLQSIARTTNINQSMNDRKSAQSAGDVPLPKLKTLRDSLENEEGSVDLTELALAKSERASKDARQEPAREQATATEKPEIAFKDIAKPDTKPALPAFKKPQRTFKQAKLVQEESFDEETQETLSAVRKVLKVEPAAGVQAGQAIKPGNFYIQMASLQSQDAADLEWSKLKVSFAEQVGTLDYRIQRADLGSRGIYYRIQAGPVDRASADAICSAIKQRKPGGCLVVGQ